MADLDHVRPFRQPAAFARWLKSDWTGTNTWRSMRCDRLARLRALWAAILVRYGRVLHKVVCHGPSLWQKLDSKRLSCAGSSALAEGRNFDFNEGHH